MFSVRCEYNALTPVLTQSLKGPGSVSGSLESPASIMIKFSRHEPRTHIRPSWLPCEENNCFFLEDVILAQSLFTVWLIQLINYVTRYVLLLTLFLFPWYLYGYFEGQYGNQHMNSSKRFYMQRSNGYSFYKHKRQIPLPIPNTRLPFLFSWSLSFYNPRILWYTSLG